MQKRAALLFVTALVFGTSAHAIISTSSSSNWTSASLNSQTGLSASVFNGVAELTIGYSTGGGAGCTGALLAGGAYVITAAHCVTNSSGALNTTSIDLSFAGGATGHVTSSSQVTVNNSWNGTLGNNNDLALLHLDTAITSITGYSLYSADPMGQSMILAGYGYTGTGSTGNTGGFGTLHWGENQYEATYSGSGTSYLWDFDNGTSNQNTLALLGVSSSLGLGSLEASIASGDSGGPSFIQLGQQLFITGVHSFGARASAGDIDSTLNFSYGEIGGDTALTGSNRSWVSSFTTAAVPEPETWLMSLGGLLLLGLRRRKTQAHA